MCCKMLLGIHKTLLNLLCLVTCCHCDWLLNGCDTTCKQYTRAIDCASRNCSRVISPDGVMALASAYSALDLQMPYNNIVNITKLSYFASLLTLNVSHNRIDTIESMAFENCKSLLTLDLSFNNLRELRNASFAELKILKRLLLDHNSIVTFDAFHEDIEALQYLDMGQNNISTIRSGSFLQLQKLLQLNLMCNNIADLQDAGFEGLHQLEHLVLHNNCITSMNGKIWGQAGKFLLHLDLSSNRISQVGNMTNLSRLQSLDLSDNQIEKMERETLPASLTFLSLYKNSLVQLGQGLLPISLEIVNLQECQLEVLGPGTFSGMVNLSTVQLSNNLHLKEINVDAFNGIRTQLKEFHIRSVPLVHLQENLIDWGSLQFIQIGSNHFICDCNLKWIQTKPNIPLSMEADVICSEPAHLNGKAIRNVSANDFSCNYVNLHRRKMATLVCVTVMFYTLVAAVLILFKSKIKKWIKDRPDGYKAMYNQQEDCKDTI